MLAGSWPVAGVEDRVGLAVLERGGIAGCTSDGRELPGIRTPRLHAALILGSSEQWHRAEALWLLWLAMRCSKTLFSHP